MKTKPFDGVKMGKTKPREYKIGNKKLKGGLKNIKMFEEFLNESEELKVGDFYNLYVKGELIGSAEITDMTDGNITYSGLAVDNKSDLSGKVSIKDFNNMLK